WPGGGAVHAVVACRAPQARRASGQTAGSFTSPRMPVPRARLISRRSTQSPEGPVPGDQRLARLADCLQHLTNDDVVIPGWVEADQLAFEPGDGTVQEGQPVVAQDVRHLPPGGIDHRCPAGKPLGDELLASLEHAHVEVARGSDGIPRL